MAIIQTLDFFTPIVDDPYTFGQIAVTNALSDVYAMGGKPLTAMNIVCFPITTMDISILHDILAGGLNKLHEAKVALVGGHSVDDKELKYGISVTGVIHPSKVLRNNSAVTGDTLILTKPLGIGIINTALKGGFASDSAVALATAHMLTLNSKAAEIMQDYEIHACTDVTGFGLLGHACEMVDKTNVGMVINSKAVPYINEAKQYAEMGLLPGGLHRNRNYRLHMVDIRKEVPVYMSDLMFDPQTSGGLIISLPKSSADSLLIRLKAAGIDQATIIGEIIPEPKGKVIVTWDTP